MSYVDTFFFSDVFTEEPVVLPENRCLWPRSRSDTRGVKSIFSLSRITYATCLDIPYFTQLDVSFPQKFDTPFSLST